MDSKDWRRSPWRAYTHGALVGLAVVALMAAAAFHFTPPVVAYAPGSVLSTAKVSAIIDGDTLDITIGGQTERVRLLGIDTPETVSRSTPKQCYGAEASNALKGLLVTGQTIKVFTDEERRDRFGRLLLFVYTEDGLLVNQWLLEGGFADVLFIEPNSALQIEMTSARNQAKASKVGLWGSCDGPDQPLD